LDAAGYGRRTDTPHPDPQKEAIKQRQAEEKKRHVQQFLSTTLDAIAPKAQVRDDRTSSILKGCAPQLVTALIQYHRNSSGKTRDVSTLTDSIVQWASSYEGGVPTNEVKLTIQKMIDAHDRSSQTAQKRLRKELVGTLDAPEVLAQTDNLHLVNLVSATHLKQETAEL
jgi:hypothetical protein